LIIEAQIIIEESMLGSSRGHFYAHGQYGLDQLLGDANPHDNSIDTLINEINEINEADEEDIWTEEQQIVRQLNNLIDDEGKSCKGCHWSGYEEGADFITCGRHYENFRSDSYCAYWTDPEDKKLLSFKKRRKEEMKAKYGL